MGRTLVRIGMQCMRPLRAQTSKTERTNLLRKHNIATCLRFAATIN